MALSDTISAITKDVYIPHLRDQIFNSTPLHKKLLANSVKLDGGVQIQVPVETTANTNVGWVTPGTGKVAGAALGQAIVDIADKATYPWATVYSNVVISGDEEHINMGKNQVLSLLSSKMKNSEKAIAKTMTEGVFAAAKATDGLTTLNGSGTMSNLSVNADALAHDNGNGLIHDFTGNTGTALWIPKGKVAESIIGYDRLLGNLTSATPGTNDFWNANLGTFEWAIGTVGGVSGATALAIDGSNDTGAVSFSAFCSTTNNVAGGLKAMTQLYGACSDGIIQPNLIITTQVIFDAYESCLMANKRFSSDDDALADGAFQSLRFKGATVTVDPACPAGHLYMLNTDMLDYYVHSKRDFSFDNWKPLEAADSIQSRITWMGQFCTSAPKYMGMLVGGPTGY
jgi:hypothetical protein